MIVNLARRDGDAVTMTPVQDVIFEGGEPHPGMTATFVLDGHETTARIVDVTGAEARAGGGAEPDEPPGTVTLELIDQPDP
jgi:hypothetical protein